MYPFRVDVGNAPIESPCSTSISFTAEPSPASNDIVYVGFLYRAYIVILLFGT